MTSATAAVMALSGSAYRRPGRKGEEARGGGRRGTVNCKPTQIGFGGCEIVCPGKVWGRGGRVCMRVRDVRAVVAATLRFAWVEQTKTDIETTARGQGSDNQLTYRHLGL